MLIFKWHTVIVYEINSPRLQSSLVFLYRENCWVIVTLKVRLNPLTSNVIFKIMYLYFSIPSCSITWEYKDTEDRDWNKLKDQVHFRLT